MVGVVLTLGEESVGRTETGEDWACGCFFGARGRKRRRIVKVVKVVIGVDGRD